MKKFFILSILATICTISAFADDVYEMPDYYKIDEAKGYYKTKNHFAFSLDGGSMLSDGYAGITLRGEYFFNDYIALDYLNTNLFVDCENSSIVSFGVRPIGIRAYTPTLGKRFRAYANLDLGWGMVKYISHRSYYYDTRYDLYHKFTIDFGLGIQVAKNVTLGYSLIKMVDFDPFHGFKLGFIF